MEPSLRGGCSLSVRTTAIAAQTGDTLDAILCAIQAVWSQLTTNPPHGIPATADPLEGWIVDPGLISSQLT